jgi:serine/threonine protein kinase
MTFPISNSSASSSRSSLQLEPAAVESRPAASASAQPASAAVRGNLFDRVMSYLGTQWSRVLTALHISGPGLFQRDFSLNLGISEPRASSDPSSKPRLPDRPLLEEPSLADLPNGVLDAKGVKDAIQTLANQLKDSQGGKALDDSVKNLLSAINGELKGRLPVETQTTLVAPLAQQILDARLEQLPAPHWRYATSTWVPPLATALTLSTGEKIVNELAQRIETAAGKGNTGSVELQDSLHKNYAQMVAGLGDSFGDAEGETLVINGKTYRRSGLLGSGENGQVFKYVNVAEPSQVIAVKFATDNTNLVHEGRLHANAVGTGAGASTLATLLGAARAPEGTVALAFKLETGGSLAGSAVLDKIDYAFKKNEISSEEQTLAKLTLFHDIMIGVLRLHEGKGMVHRDIRLDNVLIDKEGRARLADFGISEELPRLDDRAAPAVNRDSMAIPTFWSAPEAVKGSARTPKTDAWMLGMLLNEMVYGRLPSLGQPRVFFKDKLSAVRLEQLLQSPDIAWLLWEDGIADLVFDKNIHDELKRIGMGLNHPDPDQRMSLRQALESPLFRPLSTQEPKTAQSGELKEQLLRAYAADLGSPKARDAIKNAGSQKLPHEGWEIRPPVTSNRRHDDDRRPYGFNAVGERFDIEDKRPTPPPTSKNEAVG